MTYVSSFALGCRILIALVAAGAAAVTVTSAAGPDKSRYTLFDPTPAAQMRDMSTDRPDQTESPYTVDAGHIQLEMDFLNYTRDRDRTGGFDFRTEAWSVAPLNFKIGLLNRVDLQTMFDPYLRVRVEERLTRSSWRATGPGDVTTRLKVNVWGNDGGKTALAIMPFVKWPLRASDLRNGETEGGVIVPLAVDLGDGWGLGLMTELDFVRNDANTGYDRMWVNSITLARDVTERLGMYAEFFTVTSNAAGFKWQGQFDVGVTYAVSDNVQFDAGCNFGVTRSAPDYNPFVGVSYRY